jgi:pilus assembly protein CpaB
MTAMRRRFLALLAALLLAAFGAVVLFQYVQGADARARAGEVVVPVYVVSAAVPAGTDAGAVENSVTLAEVPERLVADGAVGSVDAFAQMAGMVTTTDLLPGDQLVSGRFADPAVLLSPGQVLAPAGTQEVSLTLELQRAVDGQLVAGDRVGVFLTLPVDDPATGQPQAGTTLLLNDVLVTRVSGGTSSGGIGDTGQAAVGVTLAMTPAEAAGVISGMVQNGIWLSLQTAGTAADTSVTTTSSTGADQ